ncbi:hypothetical protein [Paraflavitalea speifideaquila]|uniref:hypothetical protein n=1 Tax=Paraflavitalea speifideaquila TaxID=3076558 RepID=UPI0028E65E3F|nr:hypothetical protein [Paraflavitalea speifideiaquila]
MDEHGYVVLIVSDDGIVYIVAVSKGGKLETVFFMHSTRKYTIRMSPWKKPLP